MCRVFSAATNTQNTPVEALERAYGMRVLRYRLRRGSGGPGSSPGGEGIERDLQMLEDCTVSSITERRVSRPWGLAGGGPGAVGENWLLPGGGEGRARVIARRADNPALPADLPALAVDAEAVVADVEAGRAGR